MAAAVSGRVEILARDGSYFVGQAVARRLLDMRAGELVGRQKIRAFGERFRRELAIDAGWMFRSHWPSPFAAIALEQRLTILEDCQKAIGRSNSRVLMLRYVEELTFVQIGRAMRMSEESAASMHRTALEKMRAELGRRTVKKLAQI
jgi:DNA-directed RNA polymerase specialized sigma24 family protein